MCFAQLIAGSYAFKTVRAYVSDVYWYQSSRHQFLHASFFGQSYSRVSLLIKAHGKHETTHKQKKRQFEDAWFGQVIKGQGWEQMQMAEWSAIPHITRVAFTCMVLARLLFLRPNEFCEMVVARHSDFRPWSRASVTFWAGEKRIRVSADGIPDQSQFFNLTEVRLRDQPSKSNRAGDRAPFVCHVVPQADLPSEPDIPSWLVQGGILIWLLFTIDPVGSGMATVVPLFASRPGQIGASRLAYSHWRHEFRKLCTEARPPIPHKDDKGRVLGGHCFKVAATTAAAKQGANMLTLATMGKWSPDAFAAAQGYDYLRADHHSTAQVSMRMTLALMSVQPTTAWTAQNSVTIRGDWAAQIVFAAAVVGFTVAVLLWGTWCLCQNRTRPAPAPEDLEVPMATPVPQHLVEELTAPSPSAPPATPTLLAGYSNTSSNSRTLVRSDASAQTRTRALVDYHPRLRRRRSHNSPESMEHSSPTSTARTCHVERDDWEHSFPDANNMHVARRRK
jgi:hypothetical protein